MVSISENYSIASRKPSQSVEYGTPPDFFRKLNDIFSFQFDPCAFESNTLQMPHYYTKEDDGLLREWPSESTFINPPFGKNNGIVRWIKKMRKMSEINHKTPYVMLLPARLETSWFQDELWDFGVFVELRHVYVLKGRLKFVNADKNPKSYPHIVGSILWMSNTTPEQRDRLEETIPGIFINSIVDDE